MLDGPLNIPPVALAQRLNGQVGIGQVDALVALDQAAIRDGAADLIGPLFNNQHAHRPVIDEKSLAGLDISHEIHVGAAEAIDLAGGCGRGDDGPALEDGDRARRDFDSFACHLAHADLGALEIAEHGGGPTEFPRYGSDRPQVRGVLLDRAVTEVEPEDRDAGLDEPADRLGSR